MTEMKPLFTWRTAILRSDLPPTARHLALTLSTYMNEAGGSAFPGADRLVRDTGLSKVSVMKWRKALTDLGWLVLIRQGGSDLGGTRTTNAYEAVVPGNYQTSWAAAPEEFKDQKLGRNRSTSETGQRDVPVNDSAGTGQPPDPVPVNDVYPTGQPPVPKLSKEPSIEPTTESPQGGTSAASDASSDALVEKSSCRDDWFTRLATGLGWDPVGIPNRLRGKMAGTMDEAKALGLTLDRFSDLIWLYRAQGKSDAGQLQAALADLDRNVDLAPCIPLRRDAARILASVCADLNLGPAGRETRSETAELTIAQLLNAGVDADRIATALKESPGWTYRQLTTQLGKLDRPSAGERVPIPDRLDHVLVLDLVVLLQRPISSEDVATVTAELVDRIPVLSPRNRERLLDKLRNGVFDPVNGATDVVEELVASLTPRDPEREAAVAVNLAAWGTTITRPNQPLALPGGTTR